MIGPYYVNNEARRIATWGQPCKVRFGKATIDGRAITVNAQTVTAWDAWEKVRVEHDYRLTGSDTGAYNCRRIGSNPNRPWSAHAWATAMDINWLTNSDGRKLVTDMPAGMIRELQALQTRSGVYVFMWGGDWDRDPSTAHSYYDAMHWEVVAHPLDLATGIEGKAPNIGDNMGIRAGDRGGAVKALQIHLNAWRPAFGLAEDGIYGEGAVAGNPPVPGRTGAAVAEYQRAAGLTVNPLHADDTTLTLLASNALRNPATLAALLGRK